MLGEPSFIGTVDPTKFRRPNVVKFSDRHEKCKKVWMANIKMPLNLARPREDREFGRKVEMLLNLRIVVCICEIEREPNPRRSLDGQGGPEGERGGATILEAPGPQRT